MTIKWGVIGCGGIAYRRTIPEGIVPAPSAELVAVMDSDQAVARRVGDDFGVESHSDEAAILARPDVQVVYIASPAYLHAEQVLGALKADKHVFCEKPLALTTGECSRVVQVAEERRLKLGVGFMMRYHAHHRRAAELVRSGDLGQVSFVRAQLTTWYPPMVGAWRQDPALGGGGALVDMGCHCIDLLESILQSSVVELSAFAGSPVHRYAVDDTAVVLLEFENGTVGTVDVSFGVPDECSRNRLEIYGSNASLLAEGTIGQGVGGTMIIHRRTDSDYDAQQKRESGQEGTPVTVQPVNTYRAEIEAMSKAVADDTRPEVSGEDGLWSQRIMEACYRSARDGRNSRLSRGDAGS